MSGGNKGRSCAVVVIAAVLLLGGSVPASAADDGSDYDLGGDAQADKGDNSKPSDSGHISAHITFTQRGGGRGGGSGSGAVTVADWDPPGCWYAPEYSPDGLDEFYQNVYFAAVHDGDAQGDIRRDIADQRVAYGEDDYHRDDEGKGVYWAAQYRDDATLAEMQACDRRPFWVMTGDDPGVPNAISPEILAGLAYERMKVPSLKAKLAPAAASKVNLPTWVWLDKADVEPVSVTARLEAGGIVMEATTTATPRGMKVEPGTEDAQVIPGDGTCPVRDGAIGEPFAKGKADQTPPCGVTYLRSSGDSTYRMSAAVTWDTAWTGSNGTGGDLPDGTYGQQQDVQVQEVQSVNRDGG